MIKKRLRSITGRTGAVRGDIVFLASCNRPSLLMVFIFEVRDDESPVSIILMKLRHREFIDSEFVIFRGVGIIKSPLSERDIFADKNNKLAVLLVKKLNE